MIIHPSYLAARLSKFHEIYQFREPLLIDKIGFAKSCVLNQYQNAPYVFEQKNRKKHDFFEKYITSATAYCKCSNCTSSQHADAFILTWNRMYPESLLNPVWSSGYFR